MSRRCLQNRLVALALIAVIAVVVLALSITLSIIGGYQISVYSLFNTETYFFSTSGTEDVDVQPGILNLTSTFAVQQEEEGSAVIKWTGTRQFGQAQSRSAVPLPTRQVRVPSFPRPMADPPSFPAFIRGARKFSQREMACTCFLRPTEPEEEVKPMSLATNDCGKTGLNQFFKSAVQKLGYPCPFFNSVGRVVERNHGLKTPSNLEMYGSTMEKDSKKKDKKASKMKIPRIRFHIAYNATPGICDSVMAGTDYQPYTSIVTCMGTSQLNDLFGAKDRMLVLLQGHCIGKGQLLAGNDQAGVEEGTEKTSKSSLGGNGVPIGVNDPNIPSDVRGCVGGMKYVPHTWFIRTEHEMELFLADVRRIRDKQARGDEISMVVGEQIHQDGIAIGSASENRSLLYNHIKNGDVRNQQTDGTQHQPSSKVADEKQGHSGEEVIKYFIAKQLYSYAAKGTEVLDFDELEGYLKHPNRTYATPEEQYEVEEWNRKMRRAKAQTKGVIMQVYTHNPFLWNGAKFSLRGFATILSVNPLVVTYRDGLIYRSMSKYAESNIRDRLSHITNVQNTHPLWESRHDGALSYLNDFQFYLTTKDPSLSTFVEDRLRPAMKRIMQDVVRSVVRAPDDPYFEEKPGTVKTLCFDFLLDSHFRLYFHETNGNCAIFTGFPEYKDPRQLQLRQDMTVGVLLLAEEMLYRKMYSLPTRLESFHRWKSLRKTMSVLVDDSPRSG
eukprot:CAMPEP_0113907396 /NCGR_PEP_ID=MMETSP0780_2-20120614/25453_1 /TAXON_ID=652834 /ORGANISM="Palpitomonas bilix" /LENGTH=722 /DNA_ID=CAMNT_0000902449 /DNA_START=218 /DNA_END=2386 /DNA_ORIENTATION=+ /assembly_acc=CAM_ASM_000599